MSEALLQNAWRLHQAGKLPEAARLYADVLRENPRNFDALYQLALIYLASRKFADAERLFATAVQINSQSPDLFYNRGCALQGLGRNNDALAAFAHALAMRPDFAEARNNRGVTLLAMRRHREALACFDRVAAEKPGIAMVHNNRAMAFLGLQQPEQALAAAGLALGIDPDNAEALYHQGAALTALGRHQDALADFDKALSINPDYVEALIHRGIVFALLGRHEEAVASYSKALALRPGDIDILYNRGTSFWALRRFEETILDCEQVLKVDPQFKYARGNLLHSKLQCCDWRGLEDEKAMIASGLKASRRVLRPLQNVAISSSGEALLQSSRIWMSHECPPSEKPLWRGERYHHDRIRIAYVSADFRLHPAATLSAGVFEHHDRSRFETIAISLGADDGMGMRERMQNAFERFIDVRNRSDEEIAKLLRDMEIDIAVDMMGFTENALTAIFARRPAGLQVNYLGYPGTMGAPYMDYILADRILIPPSHQADYEEKIAYLPDTYMPNDGTRPIAERTPSRAEAGLPDSGFVFCTFNNLYKITPEMFALWMRLLVGIENSVLWLSQANPTAIRNLRREAEGQGISGERILFAPFVRAPDEHLARLRLADLFLDTLPYNAHATACDALWAGVPVVTLTGSSFAGRVGTSLLSALGLPELIADTPAAYEAIAFDLARNPSLLTEVKGKLARNRETQPLFDTARYTRNLETAYSMMWRRHQNGDPPASIAVDATTASP
ncbi:MAG: protein O-GlcNAc transferase [Alphaproteobacteria bacterium]|jgi:predicted O-linked N-acetylglucosamine transferase (SPINDLY family)|nr:protein O-GlcNAc transferase [Alphaproteobacteria bacterium]